MSQEVRGYREATKEYQTFGDSRDALSLRILWQEEHERKDVRRKSTVTSRVERLWLGYYYVIFLAKRVRKGYVRKDE